MPDGWSFNPWALSPWGADPERDAARDTARMGGGQAAPSLADVLLPSVPLKDPDDYDPADWFTRLSGDWPTVANVILAEDQVTSRDFDTVLKWVNTSLAEDKQRTDVECFHFAKYQMDVAECDISGPPAIDSDSILVIREYRQPGGGTVPGTAADGGRPCGDLHQRIARRRHTGHDRRQDHRLRRRAEQHLGNALRHSDRSFRDRGGNGRRGQQALRQHL